MFYQLLKKDSKKTGKWVKKEIQKKKKEIIKSLMVSYPIKKKNNEFVSSSDEKN